MAIVIGSARIAENGKTTGGTVGDQKQKSSTNDTIGEVSMQNFYVHAKGWYILRPKDTVIANKIAEKMKIACNNINIGYDQNNRLGVITYGVNTKTKTECDCSSLVRECVKEASGKDPGNFTTANEATVLKATGLFEDKITYTSNTALYTGDILVTKTQGHTVVVVNGNDRISNSIPPQSTSTTDGVALTVDGLWGSNTTRRLQQIFGTTQDGVISNQYISEKNRNPGLKSQSGWEWKTSPTVGSLLIKAIQKKVGVKQDGWIGKNTIMAMQKWLGSTQDGIISNPSQMVKSLQTWCNKQ